MSLFIRNRPWTFAFCLSILVVCLSSNRAHGFPPFASGIIGFDYGGAAYGMPAYSSGPGAIGAVGDVWNTQDTIDTSAINLMKNDGTLTSAVWHLSGGGGAGTPNINGAYARLLDVSTAISSASISGLTPGASYYLYLYSVYWDENIRVNGVDFFTQGIRFGTVNSLQQGVHYDMHTVIADPSGTLSFVPISAQFGTPFISSWQLASVPEPASLLVAGMVGLAWAVRKGRRSGTTSTL